MYEKYGNFIDLVPKQNSIYVTFLPDESSSRVIETAKKLVEEGYNVIPHLPARTIKDNSELEQYIGSLAEISGCNKVLVIGGGGNQVGSINSSLDVLKSDFINLAFNSRYLGKRSNILLTFNIFPVCLLKSACNKISS